MKRRTKKRRTADATGTRKTRNAHLAGSFPPHRGSPSYKHNGQSLRIVTGDGAGLWPAHAHSPWPRPPHLHLHPWQCHRGASPHPRRPPWPRPRRLRLRLPQPHLRMVSAARAHAVARLPHDGISASDRAPRQSPALSRGSCDRRRPARERHTVGPRWDQTNRGWAVRAHARLTGVCAMVVDRDPLLGRGRRGLGGRDHPHCLAFGGLLAPGAPGGVRAFGGFPLVRAWSCPRTDRGGSRWSRRESRVLEGQSDRAEDDTGG